MEGRMKVERRREGKSESRERERENVPGRASLFQRQTIHSRASLQQELADQGNDHARPGGDWSGLIRERNCLTGNATGFFRRESDHVHSIALHGRLPNAAEALVKLSHSGDFLQWRS